MLKIPSIFVDGWYQHLSFFGIVIILKCISYHYFIVLYFFWRAHDLPLIDYWKIIDTFFQGILPCCLSIKVLPYNILLGNERYEVDPLICPKCQGVMRIISSIEDPSVIREYSGPNRPPPVRAK